MHVFLKTCVSIVLSSWMAAFVTGRVALIHTWYTIHKKDYSEAAFIFNEICNNDTLKANLGKQMGVCDHAARDISIWPTIQALYSTASETYLCGNVACLDLWHDITSSFSSFLVTVAVTVLISPVVYRKILGWMYSKATKKRTQMYQFHEDAGFALPVVDYQTQEGLEILKEKLV